MSTEYIEGHWQLPKRKHTSSDSCGSKNTQEQDQIRIWAAPTTSPEISPVLEGILGRWGGLWLQPRERTLTAVTQEKHLLFLIFDLFCRFFWIFLSFFFISFLPLCRSCQFYWHKEIQLSFWALFFLSHIFYCCHKPLLLQFCVFPFFPLSFLTFNF